MKNLITIFFIATIIIGSIAFFSSPNHDSQAAALTDQPMATETIQPSNMIMAPIATSTPEAISTPTIDYQATQQILRTQLDQTQKQLDDAKRLMVEVTAQHETDLQQQASWTADADNRKWQITSWTATAAPTSIPATQTQSAFNAIMMPTNQSIIITAQAMTQQAPTQIIVIAQAQAQADHAGWLLTSQIIGGIAISIFIIALAFWLIKLGLHYAPSASSNLTIADPASSPDDETDRPIENHIVMKNGDPVYPSAQKIKDPFTRDEWMLIIEYYAEIKSLAIGKWDKKKSGRDLVLRLRTFALENKFAFRTSDGQVTLNNEGEKFLDIISNDQPLPHYYNIDPMTKHFTDETIHDHEIHEHENKPGEVLVPASVNS